MVVVDTMADNKELQCLINQRVGVKFVIGPYVSGGKLTIRKRFLTFLDLRIVWMCVPGTRHQE